MKQAFAVILFLLSWSFFAQEKDNYKEVAQKFMKNYNEGNFAGIFNMFDANMKSALPLEKTQTFLEGIEAGLGKMQDITFFKLKNVAHIYTTTFEKGVRDLLIYLNENNEIGGLYITAHIPENLPVVERNTTEMILPFNEEWTVFWGGKTIDKNYHVAYPNQKGAYDLLIMKDGKTYKGDSGLNENYYVFGKQVIAPCEAKVVKVITGVHDNIPGEMNPTQATGNTVVLETVNKEYILMAHFKENSIVVQEGQQVKQGEPLGLCGNSGNSSEPHLHLSLQNVADMDIATGGYIYFSKIKVNGETKEDYLPIKNDKIQNIKL